MIIHRLIYLILSILIVSCASSKKSILPIFNSTEDVYKIYTDYNKQIKTFSGTGNLTVESDKNANNSSFEVYIHRPDSFLIKLKGPFGISIGALMITNDEFRMVNHIEKKIQKGKVDTTTIMSLINIPLSVNNMIDMFTGLYPYSTLNFSKDYLTTKNEKQFTIVNNSENIKKELIINHSKNYFLKYSQTDTSGKIIIELLSNLYEHINGINVPHWTRLSFPIQNTSLTIAFSNIQINQKINFELNIPYEDYR